MPNRFAPACKRIIHDWRRLTRGGAPTLIACSGGADSTALALALASAKAPITLITIRHHERPRHDTDAEIAMVQALADSLNAPCIVHELPPDTLPTEAAMRRARYALLAAAAEQHNIQYIATGHHADDQLESILLALIRGTGIDGLRGIAPKRQLAIPPTGATACPKGQAVRPCDRPPNSEPYLIRPMLTIRRADTEAICRESNRPWAEDSTNTDTRRARAALRARVIPELESIRPGVAQRVNQTTGVLRDAAAILSEHISTILAKAQRDANTITWPRETLRHERRSIIAGAIRAAAAEHTGTRGRDALGHKALAPVVRAIRKDSTDPRAFALRDGLSVHVTAHLVVIRYQA